MKELKVGQRIDIYKIVANDDNYESPCMEVMGNLRPGISYQLSSHLWGVKICALNEEGRWDCDYYMYEWEVKLVGCMVVKSLK